MTFKGEMGSSPVSEHGKLLVQHLALGLADNWSQVSERCGSMREFYSYQGNLSVRLHLKRNIIVVWKAIITSYTLNKKGW